MNMTDATAGLTHTISHARSFIFFHLFLPCYEQILQPWKLSFEDSRTTKGNEPKSPLCRVSSTDQEIQFEGLLGGSVSKVCLPLRS